jgi:hypothetical protein
MFISLSCSKISFLCLICGGTKAQDGRSSPVISNKNNSFPKNTGLLSSSPSCCLTSISNFSISKKLDKLIEKLINILKYQEIRYLELVDQINKNIFNIPKLLEIFEKTDNVSVLLSDASIKENSIDFKLENVNHDVKTFVNG